MFGLGKNYGRKCGNHALKRLYISLSTQVEQVTEEEKRIFDGIFRGKGDDKAYVFRTKTNLVDDLRETRELELQTWKYVDDKAWKYDTNFTNVIEINPMLDVTEVVLVSALSRYKSRGDPYRLDYPYRDDEKYLKHLRIIHTQDRKCGIL
jgi:succinate dehydrogenase / fumarate reductase flavoprotein subunit